MIFPLCFSIYYHSSDSISLLLSIGITLGAGLIFTFLFHSNQPLKAREAFLVVSLGWLFASCFGALPFYFHGTFGSYIDCVFEAMSGFTTTGATILTNIEIQPKGLLFWRSLTHWLGGMGIILLTIAILPILGFTSGQLFNAEVPGPTKDRISPKIKDTAKILWIIYSGMTVLETLLLLLGGMSLYESLCHTFGTLATGGFSTLNASIAGYNNLYIEIIIIIFMYLAGINFSLHYYLIKGNFKDFFQNKEWRFYTFILIAAIAIISIDLTFQKQAGTIETPLSFTRFFNALRQSSFQVVSITTTTGFCTADFNLWPSFSKLLLIMLMFFGGCSGSTGGGMKQIRILITFKHAYGEIKKLFNHRTIFSLKIGKDPIHQSVVSNVTAFFFLFVLLFLFTTLFLSMRGYDIITSFSASIATLGNIGPGLAKVGAIENYSFFDPVSKIILIFSMLLGRLEIYSVLILFYSLFHQNK